MRGTHSFIVGGVEGEEVGAADGVTVGVNVVGAMVGATESGQTV